MMRVLMTLLALTFACAAVALADTAAPTDSSVQMSSMGEYDVWMDYPTAPPAGAGPKVCPPTTGATPGDEMMQACMMKCFNVSKQQLTQMQSEGLSHSDMAMACAISTKSGRPLSQILSEYRASGNWMDVAKKHNVALSDMTMMPMMGCAEEDSFNTSFISQYYTIPESDITQLKKEGHSWAQIYLLANAAAVTNQPISQIAALRKDGVSWTDIANKYNVASSDLTKPVAIRRVVAMQPVTGAGPAVPSFIYGKKGSILLTQAEATALYNRGYDWTDVAIAANVSRETYIPIDVILTQIGTGVTWQDVIRKFSLNPHTVLNVSDYPFPRVSNMSQRMQDRKMRWLQKYQPAP